MKQSFPIYVALAIVSVTLGLLPRESEAQVRLGFAAGLNYTDIDNVDFGSTTAVYNSRQGWHVGVIADIAFGPFGLKPGIFYMDAGKIFQNGLENFINESLPPEQQVQFNDNVDVRYFTFPIDLRYRIVLPSIKPYIFVGPEFRYRTETNLIPALQDNLKSFGVAGNIGAGVEVGLLGVKLLPEFRMAFDTSGIIGKRIKVGNYEFVADEAHQLRSVMLRLGVLL